MPKAKHSVKDRTFILASLQHIIHSIIRLVSSGIDRQFAKKLHKHNK